MNIPKAIEVLKDIQMDHAQDMDADDLNSIQLGIESLKAIRQLRHGTPGLNLATLPGETK